MKSLWRCWKGWSDKVKWVNFYHRNIQFEFLMIHVYDKIYTIGKIVLAKEQ